jgi:hypothetical protein
LYADAEVLFAEPGPAQFVQVEKGHGRLERRQIRASSELAEYSDFPGLKQVAEVKKRVVFLKTGKVEESTEYIMTSLSANGARPDRLLSLMRGHWGIENRLFHVKDDSFGEDRHVLCSHRGGEVMSLLRAAAINLLRGRSHLWDGEDPLTGRAQCICAQPLAVLGVFPGL